MTYSISEECIALFHSVYKINGIERADQTRMSSAKESSQFFKKYILALSIFLYLVISFK